MSLFHVSLFVISLSLSHQTVAKDVTSKDEIVDSNIPEIISLLDEYRSIVVALDIPEFELSYLNNLNKLGSKTALQNQTSLLLGIFLKMSQVQGDRLNNCQLIEFDLAFADLGKLIDRANLGIKYLDKGSPKSDGLYSLPQGKLWYQYYLKNWLGADVDPDWLFAFGEHELQLAVKEYRLVQSQLGFEGDDYGLQNYLEREFNSDDFDSLPSMYRAKQNIVRENLGEQFYSNYDVPLAKIVRSDRGMDFPVPGWYNGSDSFFYNVFSGQYDLRQMDWLFIHEATPGHHFQSSLNRSQTKCNRKSPNQSSAYTEGWAAYAETLGSSMGLYLDPAGKLGGIEWNMIRSARVAMDVGINYYGWTNDDALDYWHKNVIGKKSVAMREINRMRNWPAQVITYKYGANVFSKMKSYFLENTQVDGTAAPSSELVKRGVRDYHDLALSYGSMLLSTFEFIVIRSQRIN